MRIGMGLDGGGTKTDCLLMDHSGRILGQGRGGPSNPSRIGVDAATEGVREAANAALSNAKLKIQQVTDVCAGLAGVALPERAAAMRALLAPFFGSAHFELCTDLDLALGAAQTTPAIVLVAGTGSAAIGKNADGRIARSGGHGPKQSDEGSAFAIGKRAICESARSQNDGSRELHQQILLQLGLASLESMIDLNGTDADAVYPKVFPLVADAADKGNEFARKLLHDAARSLAAFVSDVQTDLHLNGSEFILGKTGGMISRSNYFENVLDNELRKIAPLAKQQILQTPLAEVAARRALSL